MKPENAKALLQLGIDLGEMDASILSDDWQEVSTSLDDAESQIKLLFDIVPSPDGPVKQLRDAIANQDQNAALAASDKLHEMAHKLAYSRGAML